MKKRTVFSILLLTPLFLTTLVGCKNNDNNQTYINDQEITIEIFDSKKLTNVTSISINNENIVKYENNKLIPQGIGETTATINNYLYKIKIIPAIVDVVLFTGQSNMVGKDSVKYDVDSEFLKNKAWEYLYLTDGKADSSGFHTKDPDGGKLVEVSNPTGENFTNTRTDHAEKSSGSNIMPQFCEDYVRKTHRKIIGVHVARGGKPISVFAPGGALNKDIMDKYQGALDLVNNDSRFTLGKKFYLMIQGESDTTNNCTRKEYIDTYMSFHNSIKEKFNFEFGGLVQTSKNSTKNNEGIVNIAQAKYELAMNNDDIIMVSNEPLMYCEEHMSYLLSDTTHYKAEIMKNLGSSICNTVLTYIGLDNKSLAGIEPGTYLKRANHIQSISINGNTSLLVDTTTSLSTTFEVDKKIYGLNEPECDLLSWKSSNEDIATIDNKGNVVAKKAGSVRISATSLLDNVEGFIDININ